MKDPAEFLASWIGCANLTIDSPESWVTWIWDFWKDIPPRTWHDLMRYMLQLFHDSYLYCMDVISPEWQAKSRFYHEHKEEIDTYNWQCSNSGKIIIETIYDIELQKLYHIAMKAKNDDSVRLIERTMKDRTMAKMGIVPEKIDLQKLKEAVDIVDLIRSYTGDFRYRPWALIKCPLPDHKDGTSSFSINQRRWLFKCFGCQKGWSQIDFIMLMDGCDIKTAITKLSHF